MTTSPATADATRTVRISITRDPALVRTVRLVAAAVARRSGMDDATVEAVRLAVGEACAVLLGVDALGSGAGPVEVELDDQSVPGQVTARVAGTMTQDTGELTEFGEVDLDPWTLLRGVCEDLEVQERDGRTVVAMTWAL